MFVEGKEIQNFAECPSVVFHGIDKNKHFDKCNNKNVFQSNAFGTKLFYTK